MDLRRHREFVDFPENCTSDWDRPDEAQELLCADVVFWLRTLPDEYQRLADGNRLLAEYAREHILAEHLDFAEFHRRLFHASVWDRRADECSKRIEYLENMLNYEALEQERET